MFCLTGGSSSLSLLKAGHGVPGLTGVGQPPSATQHQARDAVLDGELVNASNVLSDTQDPAQKLPDIFWRVFSF